MVRTLPTTPPPPPPSKVPLSAEEAGLVDLVLASLKDRRGHAMEAYQRNTASLREAVTMP